MSSSVEDELATNWFMEFRYPQQQENFLLFRAEQYGKGFITSIVASGITIGLTLNTVLSVHSHPNVLTSVISMSFLSITAFLVWSIVYIKSRPPSYEGTKQKNALQLLENAFLLAFSIGLDLTLVMRLLNGSCVNSLFINTWACIPSNISRSLPGDTVLCIIFIPLLCCMMLPYINKRLAAAIYVPNISFVIWALVYERATSPVTWIFLACCISLSLLYVYTMTQVQLYKYFARTKKLRQQREDIMRMKSDELKSVLGKIAHDLKTVSSIIISKYTIITISTFLLPGCILFLVATYLAELWSGIDDGAIAAR
ncbi:hypothetical protein EON65_14690 [archaeon]|nr:MAG: hypothetical protein EON65_14690 [archaeon]